MSRIQLPLFEPKSTWSAPDPALLPSWAGAQRVAIDIETRDPDLLKLGPGEFRDGRIVGVSFAIEDTAHSYYLPVGHHLGGNLDAATVFRYLRDQAATFRGDLVGANLQYDLGFLRRAGVMFQPRRYRDVRLAGAILDENLPSYSLEALARHVGLAGKDEAGLVSAAQAYGLADHKGELWKLPARCVGPYAVRDVTLPLELLRRQERKIDEEDLWDVYNLESDVLPVIVAMREKGVRVDLGRLDHVEACALKEELDELDVVWKWTGIRLTPDDVHKKDALLPVVRECGIEPALTETGQPQIDAALLDSSDHPALLALSAAKRANKIRTTFAASVRRSLVGDRIHCTMNQMRREDDGGAGPVGTVSGRMSATKPNLQQQPARDPKWGKLWRSIYIPEDGAQWACLDFSSQEPRLAVHYASLAGCRGAEKVVAAYRENARLDFHQKMADLAGIDRKLAKTIFLGLCYGMGQAKLCDSLGLPTEQLDNRRVAGPQGRALLQQFDSMVPFVRQLAKLATARAEQVGEVRTYAGRKCRFQYDPSLREFEWTHKALNRVIQGSAADQIKMAMRDLYAAGFVPALQVHDELDDSVDDAEQARAMADIMVRAAPLEVPVVVDVEIGPNWGDVA